MTYRNRDDEHEHVGKGPRYACGWAKFPKRCARIVSADELRGPCVEGGRRRGCEAERDRLRQACRFARYA
jgi:hypothetical protein